MFFRIARRLANRPAVVLIAVLVAIFFFVWANRLSGRSTSSDRSRITQTKEKCPTCVCPPVAPIIQKIPLPCPPQPQPEPKVIVAPAAPCPAPAPIASTTNTNTESAPQFELKGQIIGSTNQQVRFMLNSDPTQSFILPTAPPTKRDALAIVASNFNLTSSFDILKMWVQSSGVEVTNQSMYLNHVKIQGKSVTIAITIGEEKFRPVNGAFMYLYTVGKFNVDTYMVESLQSVDRFNEQYGPYPAIIFYNVDLATREDVIQRANLNKTRVYWVPVHHLHDPVLPEHPSLANETFRKEIGECAGLHWDASYLQMVRFRSVTMWRLPILQYFDYILSIDADAAITYSKIDFFEQIATHDRILGYLHCNSDSACTIGMWDYAEQYIKKNNIPTYDWHKGVPRDVSYSGGFLIFQTAFFAKNQAVQDLFDHYDVSGNIYFRRWAEQSIFAIAAAMFAPRNKVFFMGGEFEVTHHRKAFPRHPMCPGGDMPDCCDFKP